MEDLIEKLDKEIYKERYVNHNKEKTQKIWDSIKEKKKLLKIAAKVEKDKWGEKDIFLAPTIVEQMLIDYENIDKGLYQSLIYKIYTNSDLARIVLDGYANGGYSFLLYTLFNDNLDLTEEQKNFAIEEAMNKIGTIKKDLKSYAVIMCASLGDDQAHGREEYDIRYHILKNHNFSDKMEQLVYDFYADSEVYDDYVLTWTWDIINSSSLNDEVEPRIYYDEIRTITPEEVFKRLPLEEAKRTMAEINFIKKLHEIRPAQWELEYKAYTRI